MRLKNVASSSNHAPGGDEGAYEGGRGDPGAGGCRPTLLEPTCHALDPVTMMTVEGRAAHHGLTEQGKLRAGHSAPLCSYHPETSCQVRCHPRVHAPPPKAFLDAVPSCAMVRRHIRQQPTLSRCSQMINRGERGLCPRDVYAPSEYMRLQLPCFHLKPIRI